MLDIWQKLLIPITKVKDIRFLWISITLNLMPNKKRDKDGPLSLGSNTHIIWLWAMAQTPISFDFEPLIKAPYFQSLTHGSNTSIIGLWANEPWLKHPYYLTLSHGSNQSIIWLWAMAQTSKLLDFEPWLKLINYWTLSHGSNTSIIRLWAMAQTPKK